MHALEKILARAAGLKQVSTGEIVNCEVDMAGVNDLYLQTVRSFFEMGGKQVKNPDKVIMFMDHYAPASTIDQAENQKQFRAFCHEQGIDLFMDTNAGVCHQVLADTGLSYPGELVVVTDSHTTTHGAFGCFGTGVGATDMAIILLTGKLWFRVPEIIRINLSGKLPDHVYAKDIILHIIGELGADYAVYKGVEFCGEAVANLNMSERMALCNMTTEMGAKTAYIQPDAVTKAFLESNVKRPYTIFETDADFVYAEELNYDVSSLRAKVAAPHSVDNVAEVQAYAGKAVQQALIGTCTGGRLEDLAIAADILRGKQINKNTRLLIIPASKQVLLQAMDKGYIQALVNAGATLVTPGCACCLGVHEGLLAAGECCITASNRNFPGRMGHRDSELFLASPATVAISALHGCITEYRGV